MKKGARLWVVVVGAVGVGAVVYAVARQEPSHALPPGRMLPPFKAPNLGDDPAGVLASGLPLGPEELRRYVVAAVSAARGALPMPTPLASLQPTEYLPRADAERQFAELSSRMASNFRVRRGMVPALATDGQGPPLYYWNALGASFGWTLESVDWYGRHYAGGSMWSNLAAGGSVLVDGFKATGIEAWKNVKAAGPYLELAASFVPVYGPWVAGAIHLAYTGNVSESVKASLRAAIPGGPYAQIGVDLALGVIAGQKVDKAALAALLAQYPELRAAYVSTLAAKSAIKSGNVALATDESLNAYAKVQALKGRL